MIQLLFVSLTLVMSSVTLAEITWIGGAYATFSLPKPSNLATRTAIYESYAFLVYPRSWLSNGSITLARMSLEENEHRQYPFPNLEMQEIGNCNALQDVIDIFIDAKGLLWVLDAGYLYTSILQPCKPKILAFDLATGKVVRTIDMSDFEAGWKDSSLFSHIVVDYNLQGDVFVYVSEIMNRKIHVISGLCCRHTISLPDSSVRYSSTVDITLNLVRNIATSRVLINDERGEQMFHLRSEDVQTCSKAEYQLYTMGPSTVVILGNSQRSVVYYREKSNTGVIYKYDALNARVPKTVVYDGNYPALPRHVVPGYKCREMYLLESKTTIENAVTVVIHSLKLI